jgi:hypothetical protein
MPPDFPRAPRWMRVLEIVSGFAVFLSVIAALASLGLLVIRHQSAIHSLAVALAAIVCIVAPPLAHLAALDELAMAYHHPYYPTIMNYGRNLAIGAAIFSFDHNGQYPPHPAVLVLNGTLKPDLLACRQYVTYAMPSPPPLVSDWRSIAVALDAHSLFVYTAGDYDKIEPPENAILVYTKACHATPGYRVVVFGDFKAKLLPEADLPKYFADSNGARSKLGLPAFVLDGLPPAPPATLPAGP